MVEKIWRNKEAFNVNSFQNFQRSLEEFTFVGWTREEYPGPKGGEDKIVKNLETYRVDGKARSNWKGYFFLFDQRGERTPVGSNA